MLQSPKSVVCYEHCHNERGDIWVQQPVTPRLRSLQIGRGSADKGRCASLLCPYSVPGLVKSVPGRDLAEGVV